jgi:hypothetical protein
MFSTTHRALSIVLFVVGIAFLGVIMMGTFFPAAWWWEPRQPEYEQMILGVYFVMGIFAIIAASEPVKHLSLIWFIGTSSLVHGLIMLAQALRDPIEQANLMGDIPALIAAGILIIVLAPKRLTEPVGF